MNGATLTIALGDFPECIVRGGLVFATLRGRWHRRRRSRPAGGSARCCFRGSRRARRRHGDRQLRGYGGCGFRRVERRIQQQGVFAEQASARPDDFHEEIQIGFTHRFAGRDLDDAFAIRTQNRGELQIGQEILPVDSCTIEVLGRSQYRDHLARGQRLRIQQFDFGYQRLIQRRLQRDLSQSERKSRFGSQRGSSRDCQHQIANPNHYVIPCFAFSDFREGLEVTACATSRRPPASDKPEQCWLVWCL